MFEIFLVTLTILGIAYCGSDLAYLAWQRRQHRRAIRPPPRRHHRGAVSVVFDILDS